MTFTNEYVTLLFGCVCVISVFETWLVFQLNVLMAYGKQLSKCKSFSLGINKPGLISVAASHLLSFWFSLEPVPRFWASVSHWYMDSISCPFKVVIRVEGDGCSIWHVYIYLSQPQWDFLFCLSLGIKLFVTTVRCWGRHHIVLLWVFILMIVCCLWRL